MILLYIIKELDMAAKCVPAVKTTYNGQQVIQAFVRAWFKAFSEIPKKESIGVLYSQNCLETGGTVSMWNNNVGNVKFVPSKNQDDDNEKEYMMLTNVWEIIKGEKKYYNPPDPATWFRSFPTLEDGITEHLDFLKNHKYKSAWTAVESGNPAAFAHLLKLGYYYTAPEADYVKGMNYFFNKYMQDQTYERTVKELTKPTIITTGTTGFIEALKGLIK